MAEKQKEDGGATCPICQLKLPLSEVEAHVQAHFRKLQNSEDPILIDDDTPTVACLQCGEDVALYQYATHEAAYRYYASHIQYWKALKAIIPCTNQYYSSYSMCYSQCVVRPKTMTALRLEGGCSFPNNAIVTDTGWRIFSLQADEATAAQLQHQHNEAEESRHFEALQSETGMGEKV